MKKKNNNIQDNQDDTKIITEVYFDEKTIGIISKKNMENSLNKQINLLNKDKIPSLVSKIEDLQKKRWIYFDDKNNKIMFDNETCSITPNYKHFDFANNKKLTFFGFTGKKMETEDRKDFLKTLLKGSTEIPQKPKGDIIFVNCNSENKIKNGTSWNNCFINFKKALTKAKSGDQIWVAQGSYSGDYDMKNGVEIFGGFDGTEKEGWERDIVKNKTTFTGYFYCNNIDSTAKFNGLTFSNPNSYAIFNSSSSPSISDCTFSGCKHAALYNFSNSNPIIRNCEFTNNYRKSSGGAVYNNSSNPIFISCNFKDNFTKGNGGAVRNDNSNSVFINCEFTNNNSSNYGGAIHSNNSNPIFTKCTFSDNKAPSGGQTVYNEDSSTFNHLECNFKKKLRSNNRSKCRSLSSVEDLPGNVQWFYKNPEPLIPIYNLVENSTTKLNSEKTLHLFLKYNFIPKDLSADDKKTFEELKALQNYLNIAESITISDKKILKDILSDKFTQSILGVSFNYQNFLKQIDEGKKAVNISAVNEQYLKCDSKRVNLEAYDEKILTDPNRGHWDLWQTERDTKGKRLFKLEDKYIARNPAADIKENGIIAIDFGTKSTVVVGQDNSEEPLPKRVGIGKYSKEIEAKHYENPTVIEFIDLDSFIEKYKAKLGRPETLWEEITVSHTASENLLNSSSENYYTVFSELKQWAGEKGRKIRLKDKKGKDIILPAFLDLKENDINPIELYAYYIGLYINNMHSGIYMEYILSYPVTYEKAIREKIQKSFEKGIKKSLPMFLLENEKQMKKFRVISGASEPAAYAVCALTEKGFEPDDGEKVFYGIFDFGGGTTDFDFGLWRTANQKERRYDFVIEHFGANGDRHLGGENLLLLLSFEVFKDNQEKMKKEKCTFILPPECNKFLGSETLLNNSQESQLNMRHLMEKLRPIWEEHKGYEEEFETNVVKVDLFNNKGQSKVGVELDINIETLKKILKKRIEKGVRNFFESLRLAFKNDSIKDVKEINIFLAGNSSKSKILRDLFDEFIKNENKKINKEKTKENKKKNEEDKMFFRIHPPLGVKDTDNHSQKKNETENNKTETPNIETKPLDGKPNGKTGVAFGLIKSRKGGKIKVINSNTTGVEDEAKFRYFLGYEQRNKFKTLIDREDEYQKWHSFIDAREEDFEIYYTHLPEATLNTLEIDKTKKRRVRLEKTHPTADVFIRTKSPTVLEYVIAEEKDIEKENYLSEIFTIDLK